MAHMGRDNGVGQGVADLADVKMHLLHVRPVDSALKGIGRDAEVHECITQIRIVEAALFPASGDIAGERQAAVLSCDPGDIFRNVL